MRWRELVLGLLLLVNIIAAHAQYGYGTNKPSKVAVLELKANQKGLLIPRLALVNKNTFLQRDFGTDSLISNSLLVYNTKQTEELSPGFYYWTVNEEKGKWNRLVTESELVEPWQVQGTEKKAAENDQDIYQMGSVAIGNNKGLKGVLLYVKGPVRFGSIADTTSIGEKSFAGGTNTRAGNSAIAYGWGAAALGNHSIAVGNNVKALGSNSAVFGNQNTVNGSAAIASGYLTEAVGDYSATFGRETEAVGKHSVAFGENTYAHSRSEFVIGRYNVVKSGNKINWSNENFVFQIGIGESDSLRKNAITVRKNGWVGIGFHEPISNQSQEILRVDGEISTTNLTYPDYVFETYYNGKPLTQPDYRFYSLEEVEHYLRKNHHLPGMQSIASLNRTESGAYEFNLTKLSVQSLEKIEELYLHIIEQDKKIKSLETENKLLYKRLKTIEEKVFEERKR